MNKISRKGGRPSFKDLASARYLLSISAPTAEAKNIREKFGNGPYRIFALGEGNSELEVMIVPADRKGDKEIMPIRVPLWCLIPTPPTAPPG